MTFFEKIFKDRFTDSGSLDGIAPDMIWEGIETVIPSVAPVTSTAAKAAVGWTSYLIGAASVVAIAGAIFVFTQSQSNDDPQPQPEEKEMTNDKTAVINPSISDEIKIELIPPSKIEQNEKDAAAFAEKTNIRNIEKSQLEKNNLTTVSYISESENHQKTTGIISPSGGGKGEEKLKSTPGIIHPPTPAGGGENLRQFSGSSKDLLISASDKSIEEKISSSGHPFFEEIFERQLLSNLAELTYENAAIISEINLKNPAVSITPVERKVKKKNIKIGAFGGATLLSNSYQKNAESPDFNQLLKKTHQGVAGYSASAKIYWSPFKKIDFVTGFEYMNTVTKFEYQKEAETKMISRGGLPGLDSASAKEVRTVTHFNEQNFISLPVLVGTSVQFGKFGIGVNAGVGLNLFTAQKGKTLAATQEIEILKPGDKLPFKKSFVSYQFNPYFNFRATEKIQLQLQSTFRHQSHGMSDFYGLSQSSVLSGLSFGILVSP